MDKMKKNAISSCFSFIFLILVGVFFDLYFFAFFISTGIISMISHCFLQKNESLEYFDFLYRNQKNDFEARVLFYSFVYFLFVLILIILSVVDLKLLFDISYYIRSVMGSMYLGFGWQYLYSDKALYFSLVYFAFLIMSIVAFVDGFFGKYRYYEEFPIDQNLNAYEASFRISVFFTAPLFVFYFGFYVFPNGKFDYGGYRSLSPDNYFLWIFMCFISAMNIILGAYCKYFCVTVFFLSKRVFLSVFKR